MDKQNLNMNIAFRLCFGCSVLLNLVIFSFVFIISINQYDELSFSRKASEEAETVASFSCSGHGIAYLDGLVSEDSPRSVVCGCNACYTGPHCSQFLPDCVLDADSGNPVFLEPFWRQNAEKGAVMVAGWHRMGYEFGDGSLISKRLEKKIRMLHQTVGNAVTDGRYIVFGVGSTQLLNAAVHALSSSSSRNNNIDSSAAAAKVVASVPYYPVTDRNHHRPCLSIKNQSFHKMED